MSFEKNIIDVKMFNKLNELYDIRNKVVHRYIISYLKTRDIFNLTYNYIIMNDKIRVILKQFEEKQFSSGFGIYGIGYSSNHVIDDFDKKLAFSWANDKHLLKNLQREIL